MDARLRVPVRITDQRLEQMISPPVQNLSAAGFEVTETNETATRAFKWGVTGRYLRSRAQRSSVLEVRVSSRQTVTGKALQSRAVLEAVMFCSSKTLCRKNSHPTLSTVYKPSTTLPLCKHKTSPVPASPSVPRCCPLWQYRVLETTPCAWHVITAYGFRGQSQKVTRRETRSSKQSKETD